VERVWGRNSMLGMFRGWKRKGQGTKGTGSTVSVDKQDLLRFEKVSNKVVCSILELLVSNKSLVKSVGIEDRDIVFGEDGADGRF
jgi:hypothetical protein